MARGKMWRKGSPCPIPVNSYLSSNRHFGAIPAQVSQIIKSFVEKHPEKVIRNKDIDSRLVVTVFEMLTSIIFWYV